MKDEQSFDQLFKSKSGSKFPGEVDFQVLDYEPYKTQIYQEQQSQFMNVCFELSSWIPFKFF